MSKGFCRKVPEKVLDRPGGNSVDHKQKKDLQNKTERKRDNKDKKQSEKTQELEESKGTRIIHPFWFAVVGFILSMVALLSWFFFRIPQY
jgi:hypothetical protein